VFSQFFREDASAFVPPARKPPRARGAAAAQGGFFRPQDWSYAAFLSLPQARLPADTEAPVDFVFWTAERSCRRITRAA